MLEDAFFTAFPHSEQQPSTKKKWWLLSHPSWRYRVRSVVVSCGCTRVRNTFHKRYQTCWIGLRLDQWACWRFHALATLSFKLVVGHVRDAPWHQWRQSRCCGFLRRVLLPNRVPRQCSVVRQDSPHYPQLVTAPLGLALNTWTSAIKTAVSNKFSSCTVVASWSEAASARGNACSCE